MKIEWIVVFKPDGETESKVYPYEDEKQARDNYNYLKQSWTEVYLCKVVNPDLETGRLGGRCEERYKPLDSRCILKSGHSGKCWFPNERLKATDPQWFDRLNSTDECPEGIIGLENLTWIDDHHESKEKVVGMDVKEVAKHMDGVEIRNEDRRLSEIKLDEGVVVVFGASDDLMQFRGALNDESDVIDGGIVTIGIDGILESKCNATQIEALWCPSRSNDPDNVSTSWSYKTDIPHETFLVLDGDEVYCQGIVFSMKGLSG